MKKINIKEKLKLIKATILSGTIIFTSTGCGTVEQQEYKKEPGAKPAVIHEIEEETKTLEEEISSIATKIKEEPTTTTEITKEQETTKETEKPTTEKTTESTTTTKQTTTVNTENKIESTTTTKNVTKESQKNTVVTTTTTTNVTTKPVTTTTSKVTTKPTTTTTQTTTKPITTTAKKNYEEKLENITKSSEVFEKYADKMNSDILSGSSILLKDCNNNQYWMYGNKEARIALLILNMDQTYEKGVLSEVFKNYSEDDIKNGLLYLYRLPLIEEYTNVKIDFNNYALDKNIANYMNNLRNAAKTARETGNLDKLNEALDYYWWTSVYENYNYAAIMLSSGYCREIRGNEYEDFGSLDSRRIKTYNEKTLTQLNKMI